MNYHGRSIRPSTFWGLLALAGLGVMFMLACVLALIALEAGFGSMLLGLVCATLPVPLYVALLLWIDRFEPEPAWMLASAFLWGGLVAFLTSFILNTINMVVIGAIAQSSAVGMGGGAVLSAPLIEETSKAAILFIFFFFRKADFDGVVDGVVYAGMVALGFAMTENVLYYANGMNEGRLAATLFVRGILSPYAHPLFTSMTGIGLGWARESRSTAVKWLAPLGGLALAMFLHGVWNGSEVIAGSIGFLLTYALLMFPAFLTVLGVVLFALLREGRMIREKLKPEVGAGLFSARELERLGSAHGRIGASLDALILGGFHAWRARGHFHGAASALAFYRNRIARGTVPHNSAALEHEAELFGFLKSCKEKLTA